MYSGDWWGGGMGQPAWLLIIVVARCHRTRFPIVVSAKISRGMARMFGIFYPVYYTIYYTGQFKDIKIFSRF